MFRIGQLFFVKDEEGKRTVICLIEIDKKNKKYIFKCCEVGYKFKGKRLSLNFDIAHEKLIPDLPIFPFEDIFEDEDRIYVKPMEDEKSPTI